MIERDITKLPKWAQQRIERLQRDVAYLQAKLSAGPEDSDTFADPYSSSPRPLGKGPTVKFGDSVVVRILEDGWVDVMATNGRLIVRPRSSNVIDVRPEGR